MFLYNYFQLHINTLHQHVSVTVWTIIMLSYDNNTNSIHIIVLKLLAMFLSESCGLKNYIQSQAIFVLCKSSLI